MTTSRNLAFETCFNFRDLGGHRTADGRRVRQGLVFRSDSLHRMTADDVQRAMALGLRTVIDLRSIAELAYYGRFPAADAVSFHHVPVFDAIAPDPVPDPDEPEPELGKIYAEGAAAGRIAYATALGVIAKDDHAVVFHCAAGKDRTGVLAALLLAALGVPDDVIAADYEHSSHAITTARRWAEQHDAELAAWFGNAAPWRLRPSASTMRDFLQRARADHGSMDAYLDDLGVGPDVVEQLRARLLDGPGPRR